MATKILSENQCRVLHQHYGENDCCLCKERAKTAELETKYHDLRELVQKYFLERDKVMLSLDDEPDTREYAKAENALRKAVKQ